MGGSPRVPTGTVLTALAVLLAAGVALGMLALRPTGEGRPDVAILGLTGERYEARVRSVEEQPCVGTVPEEGLRCRHVTVVLLEGPDEGAETSLDFPVSSTSIELRAGETIVLARQADAQPGFEYSFVDRSRTSVLLWLAVLFALVVVGLGRLRGVAALAGLAVSLAVLLTFVLPAILDGRSPVLVAVVGAAAIAFLALYLAHGFTHKTTVALLGTLAGLALTALLAEAFVGLARISGFASEEALVLRALGVEVDVAGLILAGVVIGAMGAIDDVTITQASAVWELRAAEPRMGAPELFRSGLRIGRDHVASIVNTLVLAYVGASMPLFILFVLSEQSLATVANGEVVATEIVRTLIGSIGLIASVPFTTWLAARAVPGLPVERTPGTGHAGGGSG